MVGHPDMVSAVTVDIYNMAIADFDVFVDEDNHIYYQHWLRTGDRLYQDGSVLKAEGRTVKPNYSTMAKANNIADNREFLLDIIGNTDYVIMDFTKDVIDLQCWKGIDLYLLIRDGSMITTKFNRNHMETSYRYEVQYNNYINNILGININE